MRIFIIQNQRKEKNWFGNAAPTVLRVDAKKKKMSLKGKRW
jgi:hypothetical protein